MGEFPLGNHNRLERSGCPIVLRDLLDFVECHQSAEAIPFHHHCASSSALQEVMLDEVRDAGAAWELQAFARHDVHCCDTPQC